MKIRKKKLKNQPTKRKRIEKKKGWKNISIVAWAGVASRMEWEVVVIFLCSKATVKKGKEKIIKTGFLDLHFSHLLRLSFLTDEELKWKHFDTQTRAEEKEVFQFFFLLVNTFSTFVISLEYNLLEYGSCLNALVVIKFS